MPKRTDLESILIIGAGPIVIGQACEFDYSGMQACRALRQEGYRVILVNSNPATIMTDPDSADVVYIEPIEKDILSKIIERERPSALLPTMGGQTALNCAMALHDDGILERYGVEMIGADTNAIRSAEDRALFRKAMDEIGLKSAKSYMAHSESEALEMQKNLKFPLVVRPSFTLGGSGGGIVYNMEQFTEVVRHGLYLSPNNQVLLEESLLGWKEYEMEVVRDCQDNCIIVCSIENLDPMGVHTGDSITVAPSQTLTDKEYQIMRDASIAVLRKIGVDTGGSNVQFALNPLDGSMVIIEMNPRVSRSSALASKATGFPIAKIAAKLAVGYTLPELANEITGGRTPASFEPTIDYVVTKIPRFAFEKFPATPNVLGTQMKSVGEVMAIGRTFQESFQKALRGLETGVDGLNPKIDLSAAGAEESMQRRLQEVHSERIWHVADAMRLGWSNEKLHKVTAIDPWFLAQIKEILNFEDEIKATSLEKISAKQMRVYKRAGFSDRRMAQLLEVASEEVTQYRHVLQVHPVFKRVDTCAAEFETDTVYMYSCYEDFCEANPTTDKRKIMILGGGPNRIGQGIEFDYCCVHAAMVLREEGYEVIMVNCNPETISTDYDISDRLYFEPVTFEDVLEIVRVEKPHGLIVQYGGQTPLKLAQQLASAGMPIIGTSPDSIDLAEDRERFQQLIERLGLKQPFNMIVRTYAKAPEYARKIGYPLIVRPSYVLGGRAMEIVHNEEELLAYMREVIKISEGNPILLDSFLSNATEIDIDVVSDGKEVIVGGMMEHIERAGIHSGDSACSLPPYSISQAQQDEIKRQVTLLAKELKVVGLMNVQVAIQNEDIYILEVNPRASRTIPYVSKSIGLQLAKIAARCMVGISLAEQNIQWRPQNEFFTVKEAVFPFAKFSGVDPLLGPEMKSTGEVMGVGKSFSEAFAKAQCAAGNRLPESGGVLLSVRDEDKPATLKIAQELRALGYTLLATHGTQDFLTKQGLDCTYVHKVKDGKTPHVVDKIKEGSIAMIVNTTEGRQALMDSALIRREAVQRGICYTTTIAGGRAMVEALKQGLDNNIYSLSELHH